MSEHDQPEPRCSQCGSVHVVNFMRDVPVFGQRYNVQRCEDCGHEDEWLVEEVDDEAE